MKYRNLNHKRVQIYRVTLNEQFSDHFLINPDYIHENELLFSYIDNKSIVEKKVPVKAIVPYLKVRKFFGRDPETLRSKYNGYAYEIPSDIIIRY